MKLKTFSVTASSSEICDKINMLNIDVVSIYQTNSWHTVFYYDKPKERDVIISDDIKFGPVSEEMKKHMIEQIKSLDEYKNGDVEKFFIWLASDIFEQLLRDIVKDYKKILTIDTVIREFRNIGIEMNKE